MRLMPISVLTAALCLCLSSVAFADTPNAKVDKTVALETERSYVDLVIALDTSNSMDGLIDSARQKLWDIVNELATAKPTPILRVGLISYGNDGYKESGWTRVDVALTDDLDKVYEKLMALRTHGGTEYVGRAIKVARTQMGWRQDRTTLKMIFVAGNEGADQDREFRSLDEAGKAISSDIIVNTIYCGNENSGEATGWRDVALRADGRFAAIAANGGAVVINTPFDKRLSKLNDKLNATYVAYGRFGAEASARQKAEDKKASSLSGSAGAARASAKATKLYRNSRWDLVDADAEGKVEIGELDARELPREMRGMSKKERKAYIAKKKAERKKIQKEIASLAKKRDAYIAKEKKKRGKPAKSAFDAEVSKTLRKQAGRKGISFE